MTCPTCGRPAESGQPTHWLGCEAARPIPSSGTTELNGDPKDRCMHGPCQNSRRHGGKGPRPKYCEKHSDPKNRK
jgi:hypothetical protein